MKTLNQIKNILKEYFETHAQINSVYYCNDFDFNSERQIEYKVVNIEYIDSTILDKTMNHNYRLIIGDLCEAENSDMEDQIHSDCLLIAEDFFTFLYNHSDFIFNKSSSIKKFTDDTSDRASGIVFTIQISTIRPQNNCNKPSR